MTPATEESRYDAFLRAADEAWEGRCQRCGACCGAFEDPCEELVVDGSGACSCRAYASRLGPKRSRQGREFLCVPIRQVLHKHWNNDHRCAYKQHLRSPWTLPRE